MENCLSIKDFLELLQASPGGDPISLNGQAALGLIGKKIITGENLRPQNVFTNIKAAGIIWGVKISFNVNLPGSLSETFVAVVLETSIGKIDIPCTYRDKKTFELSGLQGVIVGSLRDKRRTQIIIFKD